ncbi:muramoyltetrapeptide carboxypeptidase [Lewinella marina]|uniref:LD-carboxypeptidase n=1 Tax=Neolewinella marina TaxID=438751 RepID=A0A2G0CF94_9BACT|nr:LD-carboxypeptidase [Neolewinella marina]NJB85688.1 muramoyltetrapeptide carboxypeptidase [Neolewinella marina]PHK98632.1 LD-carboxypeptidase [Neolewinella marina]
MDRRTFTTRLAATLALPLPLAAAPARRRPEAPARLRKGDTIGLITPASYLDDDGLERAVTQIESLGLLVKLGRYVRAERGFLAGTDAERLGDLHAMFGDPQVSAVWCARGGYGSGRLLPEVNFNLIRRNPKILIGYSDITALLNAITRETGMITYHGPVGSSEFTDFTERHLRMAIWEGEEWQPIVPAEGSGDPYIIHPGQASGALWGGNLSLLAAMVGTDFVPPVEGNLLFIEEVGEKPYRIDRMLTQLRQAWKLSSAAGIILGNFNDCEADAGDRSLTLKETLTDRLGDLGIPVAYGMPIGHVKDMCTLPVGGRATFDALDLKLTVQG